MSSENKTLVAMSGGVDSSVTAKLLIDKGYDCIGCTMRLYDRQDIEAEDIDDSSESRTCCSLDDVEDARSVARRLNIPYHVLNFTEGFKECVISRFVKSYLEGMTPNPCIDCNRYMKFSQLLERAKILGCRYMATGHYARIEREGDKFLLKRALDPSKDQSYVLYNLTQDQLAHTILPLGFLNKSEVRDIAMKNGFINATKRDSQDICFVPNGNYARVIENIAGHSVDTGYFVDTRGNILGEHKGIIHYTIGQHRGLGLSLPQVHYVCRIIPERNEIVLGKASELMRKTTELIDCNWISGDTPREDIRCKAKIRYRATEQWATVRATGKNTALLSFDFPQRAIAPGQAAVFYDGDIVLGGGTIAPNRD